MAKTAPGPYGEFVCSGTAAVMAITIVNPCDVVKTRMQIQGQLGHGAQPYRNTFSALFQIGRWEGIAGLQRGLKPSCCWQFSNVSTRFGVFAAAKDYINVQDESNPVVKWLKKFGLAGCSGCLGALVSNPFFIMKTRLQSTCTVDALAVGQQHGNFGNLGMVDMLREIYRNDGISGYWRGLSSFALRVTAASAAQLSTYDTAKEALVSNLNLAPTGTETHVAASLATGVVMALVMQPFDFACTRLVNTLTPGERRSGEGRGCAGEVHGKTVFAGPLCVIRQTVAVEGVLGVYKGFTANYFRIAPYNVLVFVFVEKLRLLWFGQPQ
eukprot:TRINITY_DN18749_c0_g1_i1.p1 TRINITY_DN18749_c0_g1~~TRINITY_DN18749_c0_g1_i1.p1  ORF type:complete len:325 (-),score=41.68 TRINITY_DN18749_c0_g1_i1:195-1169(-)